MSYRHRGKGTEEYRRWRDWLKQNADLIAASGLPVAVLEDEAHWEDFLDHGHLDHHSDPSRFSSSELSVRQRAAVLRLILNWSVNRLTSILGLGLVESLLDAVEQAYKH